jgi:hypothetical protein
MATDRELHFIKNRRFDKLNKKAALILLSLMFLPALFMALACSPEAKPFQAVPLSFESVTYTHQNPGFSIKYPKDWITKQGGPLTVLSVAATNDPGADAFSIAVTDETDDVTSAVKSGLDNSEVFKQYGATASIKSVRPVILSGSSVEAVEAILTTKMNTYDFWIYCYAFNRDGKTIAFIGDTMAGLNSRALIREIAHTMEAK